MLNYQYRMNKSIMFLANTLIYANHMKCGNEIVADSLLQLPNYDKLYKENTSHRKYAIIILLSSLLHIIFLVDLILSIITTHSATRPTVLHALQCYTPYSATRHTVLHAFYPFLCALFILPLPLYPVYSTPSSVPCLFYPSLCVPFIGSRVVGFIDKDIKWNVNIMKPLYHLHVTSKCNLPNRIIFKNFI